MGSIGRRLSWQRERDKEWQGNRIEWSTNDVLVRRHLPCVVTTCGRTCPHLPTGAPSSSDADCSASPRDLYRRRESAPAFDQDPTRSATGVTASCVCNERIYGSKRRAATDNTPTRSSEYLLCRPPKAVPRRACGSGSRALLTPPALPLSAVYVDVRIMRPLLCAIVGYDASMKREKTQTNPSTGSQVASRARRATKELRCACPCAVEPRRREPGWL